MSLCHCQGTWDRTIIPRIADIQYTPTGQIPTSGRHGFLGRDEETGGFSARLRTPVSACSGPSQQSGFADGPLDCHVKTEKARKGNISLGESGDMKV